MKKFVYLIALQILILSLFSCEDPTASSRMDVIQFSTKEGTRWEYNSSTGSREKLVNMTTEIIGPDFLNNGLEVIKLETVTEVALGQTWVRDEYWHLSDSHLIQYSTVDDSNGYPLLFFPLIEGDHRTHHGISYSVTSTDETVSVPSGSYTDCVLIKVKRNDPIFMDLTNHYYWKNGIGIVRVDLEFNDSNLPAMPITRLVEYKAAD